MIAMARKRAPNAEFCHESFVTAKLPQSVAVTAIRECFNYLFDRRNTNRRLLGLFRRVHEALAPGGLFIFDVAGPGRVPAPGTQRKWWEAKDWAVLVETEEDRQRRILT